MKQCYPLETRRISKQFKDEVSRAVAEGTLSIPAIANRYGVSVSQVMRWKIRWENEQAQDTLK